MTTVRSVVQPGWIEVSGPDVLAVVAAADRHAEALTEAAQGGLVALLEALTAHGLAGAPDLAAVSTAGDVVRVVVRGAGSVVLADGTRFGSDGRLPWRDLDVPASFAGAEVSVEAPQPEAPRGWRRPARLARTGEAVVVPSVVADDEVPEPEVEVIDVADQEAVAVVEEVPEDAPAVEPEVDDAPEDSVEAEEDAEAQVEADAEAEVGEVVEDAVTDDDAADEAVAEGADEESDAEDIVDEGNAEDDEPVDATADEVRVQPDLTLPPPDETSAGLPPAARVPVSTPPKGGLIESVPWRRGAASEGASSNPPTAELPVHTPPPPPPPGDDVPPPPHHEEPAEAAEPEHRPQDTVHDLPEQTGHPEVDAFAAPDVTTDRGALHRSDDDLDRPVVLAVLCPAGHASPPHAGTCRTCGREIPPQQPFQTPRPALGVLRISTGGVVPLDRGVLLGRAPRVNEELPPSQRPHLLRVGGADRDISRNHAEVVLEGWHVLVRDLGSTNGTTVTLPGQEAVRLRPTEDHGIEPGAVITLADEVSLTYEVDG